MTDIIGAVIGAVGGIIAAIIAAVVAARSASKKTAESVRASFLSYKKRDHDATEMLNKAQNDVFFVAAIGNKFLDKYPTWIENLLMKGIDVYCLILTKDKLKQLEKYINGHDVDISFRENIIEHFKDVKMKTAAFPGSYKGKFEAREYDDLMTVSYVCTDLMPDNTKPLILKSSAIQIMIYQYNTIAEESPITVLTTDDEEEYKTTVKCIKEMWAASKKIC